MTGGLTDDRSDIDRPADRTVSFHPSPFSGADWTPRRKRRVADGRCLSRDKMRALRAQQLARDRGARWRYFAPTGRAPGGSQSAPRVRSRRRAPRDPSTRSRRCPARCRARRTPTRTTSGPSRRRATVGRDTSSPTATARSPPVRTTSARARARRGAKSTSYRATRYVPPPEFAARTPLPPPTLARVPLPTPRVRHQARRNHPLLRAFGVPRSFPSERRRDEARYLTRARASPSPSDETLTPRVRLTLTSPRRPLRVSRRRRDTTSPSRDPPPPPPPPPQPRAESPATPRRSSSPPSRASSSRASCPSPS